MTKKVLIVEDDKLLSRGLDLKLRHEGIETALAVDGEEALKLLKAKSFDVVLLDLVMPAVDGFQVLERLHEQKSGTLPVIFVLTNLSQHEDEVRVRELGAQRFFIKSDTPLTEIVNAIKAS